MSALDTMKQTEVADVLENAEFQPVAWPPNQVLSQAIGTAPVRGFTVRFDAVRKRASVNGGIVHNTFVDDKVLPLTLDTEAGTKVWLVWQAAFPVGEYAGPVSYRQAGPSSVVAWLVAQPTIPDAGLINENGLVTRAHLLATIRRPVTEEEEAAAKKGWFFEGGAGLDPITLPPLGGRD